MVNYFASLRKKYFFKAHPLSIISVSSPGLEYKVSFHMESERASGMDADDAKTNSSSIVRAFLLICRSGCCVESNVAGAAANADADETASILLSFLPSLPPSLA